MQTVHTGKDSIDLFSQDAWTSQDPCAGPQACILELTEPDHNRPYELAVIWENTHVSRRTCGALLWKPSALRL